MLSSLVLFVNSDGDRLTGTFQLPFFSFIWYRFKMQTINYSWVITESLILDFLCFYFL